MTVDQPLELFCHLLPCDVLCVEIRGGADVAAEITRGAADEHAAVEDERQALPARVTAKGAAELKAIELGHTHVGNDRVDALTFEGCQRRFAVGGGEDFVPSVPEDGR